jgi:hypothetical protein
MEHNGVHFRILQTSSPTGFKWIVDLRDGKTKAGETVSRSRAISLAIFAIDKALKPSTGTVKPASDIGQQSFSDP